MNICKTYNKNHKKWFVKKCVKALNSYGMIEPKERVCVALSGGKDSAVLLYILWYLRQYAGINFELCAAHIKTAEYDASALHKFCKELELTYIEGKIRGEKLPEDESNVCYICSRLKRGALKELAEIHDISKIAYGHHADDVAETFFMNIVHSSKLGSFSPILGVPDCKMRIIRPMIYLREQTIQAIHSYLGLPLITYRCPHEPDSKRVQMKKPMAQLDGLLETRGFVDKLVAALENVDRSNSWPDLKIR